MDRVSRGPCAGTDGGHAEPGSAHVRGRALREHPGVSATFTQAVTGQACLGLWRKDGEPDWHYRGCVLTFDPPLAGLPTAALVWGRNAGGIPRATLTEGLPLRDTERLLAAWRYVRRWGNTGRKPGKDPDPDPLFPRRYLNAVTARWRSDPGGDIPRVIDMAAEIGVSPNTFRELCAIYGLPRKPMWPPPGSD